MKPNNKIAVIGGGAMGLTCAYRLLKQGYLVSVFEKGERLGGMAASFDFDGLNIEKFYHFICLPDTHLFNLLAELGIKQYLNWKETKMGFFYEGKLYKWGNPFSLFFFPELDFISKIRYGLHIFLATRRKNWKKLDKLNAISWIERSVGLKASNMLWSSLFDLKFYQHKDNLSAAWIWSRLKRMGTSRKNLWTEKLGYIEGGSEKLLNTLSEEIKRKGGQIFLNSPIATIDMNDQQVMGLTINEKKYPFDAVISTIPLPYMKSIAPNLPEKLLKQYNTLENIGVVCGILKLKNQLTENFWLNINDRSMKIPGIIEYSNLNPLKEKVVYFPFYLHRSHENFSKSDDFFYELIIEYSRKINPEFTKDWILGKALHRYEYAQPVCPPEFLEILPPINVGIKGLYIADTSHYYPEDRSISESIRIGEKIASVFQKDVEGR